MGTSKLAPLWAGLITAFQLTLFLTFSSHVTLKERYQSAYQWDSVWYQDIASRGYVSTIPPVPKGELSNVTHFPLYPAVIRAVYEVGHHASKAFDYQYATLISAQASCFLFWWLMMFILDEYKSDGKTKWLFILLTVSHPGAFFMITGLSESLFCFCAFAFVAFYIRWLAGRTRADFWWSALAGFAGAATRISGALLGAVPVALLIWSRIQARGAAGLRKDPPFLRVLAIGAICALGTGIFFIFCQLKFGIWNLYQIRQDIGWHNQTDYLALFKWRGYNISSLTDWPEYFQFGQLLRLPTVLLLAWGIVVHAKDKGSLPYWLTSFFIFYVAISSLSHSGIQTSWVRYHFPIWVGITLGGIVWLSEFLRDPKRSDLLRISTILLLAALIIGGFYLQIQYQRIFSVGGYVI